MGDAAQEEGWVVCRIFKKKNHLKTLDSPLASSISGEGRRSQLFDSCDEGALEQILQQMGRGCKEENNYEANNYNYGRYARPFDTCINNNNNGGYHDRFMKLPSLESPKSTSMESQQNNNHNSNNNDNNENGYHPIIPVEMVTENEGSFACDNPNNMVHHHHHHPLDASPSSMVVGSGGGGGGLTNWAALDRLVASQLNGQTEASRQLACFNDPTIGYCTSDHDLQLPAVRSSSSLSSTSTSTQSRAVVAAGAGGAYIGAAAQDYTTSEIDLWNFARSASSLLSSSEALCHVSNTSV